MRRRERMCLIFAVPSKFIRHVFDLLRGSVRNKQVIVNLTKGFEAETLKTISQIAEEMFGPAILARWITLSGPSFARELARNHPTARGRRFGESEELLEKIQSDFSSTVLRVYRSDDLRGLEVAGSREERHGHRRGHGQRPRLRLQYHGVAGHAGQHGDIPVGNPPGCQARNLLGTGRDRRPDADLFRQPFAQFSAGAGDRRGRIAGRHREFDADGGRRGGDDQGRQATLPRS